jgi:hypothetical protein
MMAMIPARVRLVADAVVVGDVVGSVVVTLV